MSGKQYLSQIASVPLDGRIKIKEAKLEHEQLPESYPILGTNMYQIDVIALSGTNKMRVILPVYDKNEIAEIYYGTTIIDEEVYFVVEMEMTKREAPQAFTHLCYLDLDFENKVNLENYDYFAVRVYHQIDDLYFEIGAKIISTMVPQINDQDQGSEPSAIEMTSVPISNNYFNNLGLDYLIDNIVPTRACLFNEDILVVTIQTKYNLTLETLECWREKNHDYIIYNIVVTHDDQVNEQKLYFVPIPIAKNNVKPTDYYLIRLYKDQVHSDKKKSEKLIDADIDAAPKPCPERIDH